MSTVSHDVRQVEANAEPSPRNVARWTDNDLITAWQTGRDYEHARLADYAAELDATQLVTAAGRHRDRVQARLDEFADCAARINGHLGRPAGYCYRGGPVDYETGMPSGSACAWLRRRTLRPPDAAREAA